MKICYFGDYDIKYSRSRVLLKGLRENGIYVSECNSRDGLFKKIIYLISRYREVGKNCEIVIVGYSDRGRLLMVLLAKIISRKPIVWDAFYSLYDSWVFDRKLTRKYSLKAFYYWLLDWLSCIIADKILLDTNEHIKYFNKIFKINKNKFIKVLIGADNSVFCRSS